MVSTQPRLLIPVGILLALLGLAATLIFNEPNTLAPESAEDVSTEVAEAPASRSETPEPELETEATLKRTNVESTQVESGHGAALLTGGVSIRVVDDATGSAMPAAEVLVLDSHVVDMKRVQQMMASGSSLDQIFRALGKIYTTNENGEVRIPEPMGRLRLAGSTPTHFGFQFQPELEDLTYTLRISPMQLLHVRVVDESGQPVQNAPVALRHRSKRARTDIMFAMSNAEGLATLKVFDGLQKNIPDGEAYVALRILSPTFIEVPANLDNLSNDPLELVMPETGKVQVFLEGVDDAPSLERFLVQLSIFDSREANGKTLPLQRWDFGAENLLVSCSYKEASVSFPFVALDQKLRVRVSSQKGERTGMVDGLGPERLDRNVVLTVTPTGEFPLLAGRLLDAKGNALNHKSVLAMVNVIRSLDTQPLHQNNVRCDSEGFFLIALSRRLSPETRYTLTLTQAATKTQPTQIVHVEFDGDAAQEKLDFGDLSLQEAPMLAQGIVIDYQDNFVKGAYLHIEAAPVDSLLEENVYWNSIRGIYAYTQEDGAFEMRGLLPNGRYRVSASHGDHGSVEVEIPLGSTDLMIQLPRSGDRHGLILLDAGIEPKDLRIAVETKNAKGWTSSTHISLKDDGSFDLDDLPPQVGTIRIKAAVYGEDLLVYEDIMLQSPETEMMLEVIDLRGMLTFFSLRVLDEYGVEVERPKIMNHEGNRMSFGSRQPLKIITRRTSLDLEITALGYRSAFLSAVNTDQDVVLSIGIPIALNLENAPELPAGWLMEAHLSFQLPGTPNRLSENMVALPSALPLTGEEVRIAKAEQFRVLISLVCRDHDSPSDGRAWMMYQAPDDIVVEDSTSLQTFYIALSANALDFIAKKTAPPK